MVRTNNGQATRGRTFFDAAGEQRSFRQAAGGSFTPAKSLQFQIPEY